MRHFLAPLVATPERVWGLRDATSGGVLATRLELAADAASRKKGLLGRDRLDPGTGLVIAPCGGVHTFFMRFSIDVIFVARDGRVLKVRSAVKPWRLTIALTAFCVVELRAHAARDSRTSAGHRLELFQHEPDVPSSKEPLTR